MNSDALPELSANSVVKKTASKGPLGVFVSASMLLLLVTIPLILSASTAVERLVVSIIGIPLLALAVIGIWGARHGKAWSKILGRVFLGTMFTIPIVLLVLVMNSIG